MATDNPVTLSRVKDHNITAAQLAAAATPLLIERLAVMAQTSQDPEVVRKIVETLHKVGTTFEEKKTQVVFQQAQFAIILDDNTPQIAPPKRSVPIVDEVIDIPPALPGPDPDPVSEPALELAADEGFVELEDELEQRLLAMEDDA